MSISMTKRRRELESSGARDKGGRLCYQPALSKLLNMHDLGELSHNRYEHLHWSWPLNYRFQCLPEHLLDAVSGLVP